MFQINFKKLLSLQNVDLVCAILLFLLVSYYDWSFELAIALALWVYTLLRNFSSDFYVKIALLSTLISGVALAINRDSISESLGVVTFVSTSTFLVMKIATRNKRQEEEKK